MNVSVVTVFPELYKPFLATSLFKRGQEQGLLHMHLQSLFAYVQPKERIDDTTFGHSSGMLIRPEVVQRAIDDLDGLHGKSFKIFLSPQGTKLTQSYAKQLWQQVKGCSHLMFFASRYEGVDARVEQHYADAVVSVGDFVTMGGDVPAMLLMECLFRHMPGIVGKEESVQQDSFSGAFVDHPEYTRPVVWKDKAVPEILRSGNHAAIAAWRQEQAATKTVKQHFNWVRSYPLSNTEKALVAKNIPHHYVALMHTDVLLKEGRVGTTSVTSIDIHDIARSSATYGLKKFFIVTPLKDQQKLVQTVLDFWHTKEIGGAYNQHRYEAVAQVRLQESLHNVIEYIKQKEGKEPIILGTSARQESHAQVLTYGQQDVVWKQDRPVLFLFGTGHGMSSDLLARCDYMLPALGGFGEFNHLSVRSAAAIVFDKWLGVSLA